MFNEIAMELSPNGKSIDYYSCEKGKLFWKDQLMKVLISVDSNNSPHIYHSYNLSERLEPYCE